MSAKETYIDALLKSGAFLVKSIDEEPFTLRSGKKSCMFLNHSLMAANPDHYKAFIDVICESLLASYQKNDFILCNVDSKISAQMVGSLAYTMSKSQIVFKSKALTEAEKGIQKQLTGDSTWKLPVAIIDDVMTGGDGTAKNVGDLVKGEFKGITDIQIFVGFIREPKESTYPTHHVTTRDELITQTWDRLSDGQKQAIEKERKIS